jgi:hypothetical protein
VAAVEEWLFSGQKFHYMHEDIHDRTRLNGGMWAARAVDGEHVAIAELSVLLQDFATAHKIAPIRSDIDFLNAYIAPAMSHANSLHHVAKEMLVVK